MTAARAVDVPAARNRFLQKKAAAACGIATAEYRLARNHRELVRAHVALGFPGVLKLQLEEDVPEGPWPVADFDDVPRALRETKGRPLLWERPPTAERIVEVTVGTEAPPADELGARALVAARAIGERLGATAPYRVRFLVSEGALVFDELAFVHATFTSSR